MNCVLHNSKNCTASCPAVISKLRTLEPIEMWDQTDSFCCQVYILASLWCNRVMINPLKHMGPIISCQLFVQAFQGYKLSFLTSCYLQTGKILFCLTLDAYSADVYEPVITLNSHYSQ